MKALAWLRDFGACLLCCAMALSAQAQVGLQQRVWTDPTRQAWGSEAARPVKVTLWYPAAAGVPVQSLPAGPFDLEPVAIGAAAADSPRRLPLLLLSHGTGGSAMAMAWLGHALARQGYLVAAPDHHGNSAAEGSYQLEAFIAWWDRPRDLTVLLDRLLADPVWGPRVDTQRIGVIGFSLGGYTALASLGARLDPQALQRFLEPCLKASSCPLPPEISARFQASDVSRALQEGSGLQASLADAGRDWRDGRIRAGLVLAPVHGRLTSQESLAGIQRPVHLIASDADDQAPAALTARLAASSLPAATLHVLSDATHYSFVSPCTAQGQQMAPAICADPKGFERRALHEMLRRETVAFFVRTLAEE
ncbi:alpha/beta hydrolase family protein [Roseateles sp.]|uniref:alpha/beta hydrolase family protein n=1 Tax=Roseateles sp. TaxID=1971397 RepID=UPI003D11B5AE